MNRDSQGRFLPKEKKEEPEKEEKKEIALCRSKFSVLFDDLKRNFREKFTLKGEDVKKAKDTADKAMSIATQVSDVFLTLSSLRHAPGPMAWMAAGTKLGNILYHHVLKHAIVEEEYIDPLDEYLDRLGGKWIKLETNKNRIVKILDENHLGKIVEREKKNEQFDDEFAWEETQKRKDLYSCVKHATVEGNDIIWKQASNDHWVFKLMIRAEQKESVFQAIGNLIWKSYGTNHLTVASTIRKEYSNDSMLEFMEDLLSTDILQSEIGDKIAENTRKFLSHPQIETRAILLYGPPGTGKSTAARYISHILNMRSLRVGYKLLTETATLIQCLDILRPDVIIVDDIDRSPTDGYLLESLELLRKRTKVILTSANHPATLDYAVLRPGRFDEAIKIETLDEKVIRRTVGEEIDEETYEMLHPLPIAYINEFALRRIILGEEAAAESVRELYERIEMGDRAYGGNKEITKEEYRVVKMEEREWEKEIRRQKENGKKTAKRKKKKSRGNGVSKRATKKSRANGARKTKTPPPEWPEETT